MSDNKKPYVDEEDLLDSEFNKNYDNDVVAQAQKANKINSNINQNKNKGFYKVDESRFGEAQNPDIGYRSHHMGYNYHDIKKSL